MKILRTAILFAIVAIGVAIGAAVIVPNFLKARTVSSKSPCICYLKQMDGAKATWALENKRTTTDTPAETEIFGPKGYILDWPVCPEGGLYTLGDVGQMARCSLAHHFFGHSSVEVIDASGARLAGARVEVWNGTSAVCGAETRAQGEANMWECNSLAQTDWWNGSVYILVSKKGYQAEKSSVPTVWPLRVTLKVARPW